MKTVSIFYVAMNFYCGIGLEWEWNWVWDLGLSVTSEIKQLIAMHDMSGQPYM